MNESIFNVSSNLTVAGNVTTPIRMPSPFERTLQHKIISTIATSVLIILTLAGNALVLAAFYSYKRIRRGVTNCFIVSLAVADILVALLTEPFWMSVELTGWMNLPEGIDATKLQASWYFLDITCAICSIVNLMFISIDRYFAIKSPLSHHTKMTPETAKVIIPILWAYAAMTASLSVFFVWKWSVFLTFIIGFLIPLIVVIFSYVGILIVISSKQRLSNRGGKRLAKEFKTAKSLGVVTGAFIICWLPFFIASLLFTYCISCTSFITKTPAIISSVKWLHYSNSCLNPIIYAFLNPTFKVAFRNLFRKLCHKNERDRFDHDYSFTFFSHRTKNTKTSDAKTNTANGKITNGGFTGKGNVFSRCCKRNPGEFQQPTPDSTTGSGSEQKGIEESPVVTPYTLQMYCSEKSSLNLNECSSYKSLPNNPNNFASQDESKTPLLDNKDSNTQGDCNVHPPTSCLEEPLLNQDQRLNDRFTFDTEYLQITGNPEKDGSVGSHPGDRGFNYAADSKTNPLSSDLDVNLIAQLDPKKNELCFFVDGVAIPEGNIKSSDV